MTDAPTIPAPSARWSWLGVGAMVVLVLGLPMLLKFGPTPRRPFDEKPVRLMKKEQPRVVLIGDSMLETRIDQSVLNRVSSERCFVFAQPGSSSALWFLMLKNIVAQQTTPPRTVIILFRGRQLTLPTHRAEGDYRKSMEPYMRDREPLVEQLAGSSGRKPADWMEALVQKLYPVDRRREQAQDKVQAWSLDLVASSREYEHIHNHAKVIFGPKHLRVGTAVDEQKEGGATSLDPDEHDFAAQVGQSFLPHLLEIARERDIQLVFFEVKRRPNPDGTPGEQSSTNAAYDDALRAYLEKAGARLFDETGEADVTVDFYGSGDHVAPKKMPEYTELFWRKIAPLVEKGGAR